MKILILGIDGYLGWTTAMYLSVRGHQILGADSMVKRHWEQRIAASPLIPLPTIEERVRIWNSRGVGVPIQFHLLDIAKNHEALNDLLREFKPDAIIDYAEQPSAPFSMKSRSFAMDTLDNNLRGTMNLLWGMQAHTPEAHLIKLGTMGEYGTPGITIEEGYFDVTHKGRTARVAFPKCPGSIYHATKVADTEFISLFCRASGVLRATDINQGVVYGLDTEETALAAGLHTSFHYDECFGTVYNRFIAQAVCGIPLTVYGKGGQTRGFLNIRDVLQCVELVANNPPKAGEHRVVNQFCERFSVRQLADHVAKVANELGLETEIGQCENPRVEAEEHFYEATNETLVKWGLKPTFLTPEFTASMLKKVQEHRSQIHAEVIRPRTQWRKIK